MRSGRRYLEVSSPSASRYYSMDDSARSKLEQECKVQAESCLYTSTTLHIWVRRKRSIRSWFIVLPIIFAGIGSWSILTALDDFWARLLTSGLTLLAGLLPSIYSALKYDDDLNESIDAAGEFKVLQKRFRQAPILNAEKTLPEFEAEFRSLMDQYEEAQKIGMTTPEWAFRKARKKIQAGHYDPDDSPSDSISHT